MKIPSSKYIHFCVEVEEFFGNVLSTYNFKCAILQIRLSYIPGVMINSLGFQVFYNPSFFHSYKFSFYETGYKHILYEFAFTI